VPAPGPRGEDAEAIETWGPLVGPAPVEYGPIRVLPGHGLDGSYCTFAVSTADGEVLIEGPGGHQRALCQPRPRWRPRDAPERREFAREYDESIAHDAGQIDADDLRGFAASTGPDDPAYDSATRLLITFMAADYVYSGRPEEARRTIERMWPAWDRASLIEEIAPG